MATMHIHSKRWGDFNVQLDDEDYDALKHLHWYVNRQSTGYFYVRAHIPGLNKVRPLHKVILPVPKGMVVDHINHDTMDNRRSNLRAVSRHGNNLNKIPASHITPYMGVYYSGERYYIVIKTHGMQIRAIGFDSAKSAREMHRRLISAVAGEGNARVLDSRS